MNDCEINQQLLDFIAEGTDCFHAISAIQKRLDNLGYICLSEGDVWQLQPDGKYYVTRNQSSLIAFRIPKGDWNGFMMTASHSDAPTFKVKPHSELFEHGYLKLNTEKYGGMIPETWMDRPLSLSGRVVISTDKGISSQLVKIDRDLLVIPSVAPHMQSAADKDAPLNPQIDLLPLFSQDTDGSLRAFLAEELGLKESEILDADLFLYPRVFGTIWGKNQEFISSPRLDDLQCTFASMTGFLGTNHPNSLPVFCVFDNEEVGSGTKQGAKSTFLADTLFRISESLGMSQQKHLSALRVSFMLSCDNGHALHPNHPEKSDPTNRPKLNGGVVIKYIANQIYTTDAISGGIFQKICKTADVPVQTYTNRSDKPGGSTLGNLSTEKVSVNTVDIGLAQLAMHSTWETAGAEDTLHLCRAMEAFYKTSITANTDGNYSLNFI